MSRFAWILLLLPSVATPLSAQEFRGRAGRIDEAQLGMDWWRLRQGEFPILPVERVRVSVLICERLSIPTASAASNRSPSAATCRRLSPQRVGARRAAGPPSGFSARQRARRNRRALPPAASPLSVGSVDSGTRLAACLRIGLAGRGLFLLLLLAPQVGAMVLFLAAAGLAQVRPAAFAVCLQRFRAARAAT